jgi:hypothetical protein
MNTLAVVLIAVIIGGWVGALGLALGRIAAQADEQLRREGKLR